MKITQLRTAPCNQGQSIAALLRSSFLAICLLLLFANSARAGTIEVLKMGLGFGTVRITVGATDAINCRNDCTGSYDDNTDVTIVAQSEGGSVFLGWLGAAGIADRRDSTLSFNRSGNVVLRPVFGVRGFSPKTVATDTIPEDSIHPGGIQRFLRNHPQINSPARFVAALPRKYRMNWILMTRSESLQTGTAKSPRLILPGPGARNVFSIGMVRSASFPGSHPFAIEYMQWDAAQRNFRFHEIMLGDIPEMGVFGMRPSAADRLPPRKFVEIDDKKCFACHSTRNVPNPSGFPGTTGVDPFNPAVPAKSKPNWDTYDSWAGMMPFNRDRIYQGSVEATVFKKIFTLWTWRGTAQKDSIRQIVEQLFIQSPNIGPASVHRITRDTNAITPELHIRFGFDGLAPISTSARLTSYTFGGPPEAAANVAQGGRYVTVRHTDFSRGMVNESYGDPLNDEGRGVILFDQLGGLKGNLNQLRIADEIATHTYATGSHPVDVRPIALAIARGLIVLSGDSVRYVRRLGITERLSVDSAFFEARNGMTLKRLVYDTKTRAESLPRRKADLQKSNMDRTFPDGTDPGLDFDNDPYLVGAENGLKQEYISAGRMSVPDARNDILRRPVEAGIGIGAVSVNGGAYIDREQYGVNLEKVALFRYFLEPLGVSVDKWNMNVRGRSRLYTFADVFGGYPRTIDTVLTRLLREDPRGLVIDVSDNNSIIAAVNTTLNLRIDTSEAPRFTDIQRIFNKACIECHGGLDYPPYFGFGPSGINFSENDTATGTPRPGGYLDDRMYRSYDNANRLANSILRLIRSNDEGTPAGMMPYGGPKLSQSDVETIRRWVALPTRRPYTVGDPHIMTVNGTSYDFQAAGEFVALRGDYIEVQTRQKAVAAAPFGPNAHTGLKTCVSVNTAVALHFFGRRITYQPNPDAKSAQSSMELRVDGELVPLGDLPKVIGPSARIRRTNADGGIQIEGPGGSAVVLTPGFWQYYNVPWLFVDVIQLRANQGLMGIIQPGNWLPALPDGRLLGPRPKDLGARYKILYNVFGDAWRVTDSISLFDYPAGQSTEDFSFPAWPSGNAEGPCVPPAEPNLPAPLPPMAQALAEASCQDIADPVRRALCVMDLVATGEKSFADVYLAADKILRNRYPKAPKITYPTYYQTGVKLPIKFTWDKAIDEDGDRLTYRHLVWPISELPDDNLATSLGGNGGWFGGGAKRCYWIIGLIALLLLILLYIFLRKKKKLFTLLAVLLVILAIALMVRCRDKGAEVTEYTVTELKAGKSYYWKVIVEDDNGGVTESEIGRFELE